MQSSSEWGLDIYNQSSCDEEGKHVTIPGANNNQNLPMRNTCSIFRLRRANLLTITIFCIFGLAVLVVTIFMGRT